MQILILGGTQFLGRYLVETALARGHAVTLFNRGRTNPELFPSIEKLRGDRNGNLAALKDRTWDAAIDTCGYSSGKVRATAGLLADSVARYIFISSISVYRDFSRPGLDESAPLAQLPAGATEMESDASSYGARKVLCEQAAEETLPGRVLQIRPGIIAGPHDRTGRFAYWVRRVARGGEVLAPGEPATPIQLIDVRDLAHWTIQLTEQQQVGAYNVTGPAGQLTFQQMLETCKIAGGSDAHFTWVDEQFLLDQAVTPFSDLPFWIPKKEKGHAGFFAMNCAKAFQSGLTCRPLTETARDTLDWERGELRAGEPAKPIGLKPEREQELLHAWKAR